MQHKSTYRRVLSLGLIFVLAYLILPSQNALNCQVSPTPAPVIIFGEDMDIGYDLIEPEPGQYILTGQTHSFGNGRSDIWLMEVDDEGVVHWNITFGGIADETGRAIINCQNGDYAVVGYTSSFGAGSYDLWLLRISPTGQLLWNRTYGTPGFDYGAALIEIEEHLYICGYTDNGYVGNNDLWLICTDAQGNHQWNQTYGGSGEDIGWSIIATATGFLIAGYTESYGAGQGDVWVVHTTRQGLPNWNATFGGPERDGAWQIIPSENQGYSIIGYTRSYGAGGSDLWLLTINEDGAIVHEQIIGGLEDDVGYSLIETYQGNLAFTGYSTNHLSSEQEIWCQLQGKWSLTATSNGAPIHGMSIIECSQGGFAIIGTVDTVPGAISHFVFWRIPANYNPMPSISPEQLLLITISGSLIIAFLVIIFWRKQNHPTQ